MATTTPSAVFTAPAEYVDSDHPTIVACATGLLATATGDPLVALYELVRDLPYAAGELEELDTYRASTTLAAGHGHCVSKAALLAALARAAGHPARVGYADVRNHLASPRLLAAMGTDVFAWHGFTELWVGDRWVRVSPTFDRATCARFGVPPLAWDGVHDALLQAFDGGGTMQYVAWHGSFHDVPARFLAAEMCRRYPFVRNGGISRFQRGDAA